MSFFQKYISSVLVICLCLNMTSNQASLSIPIPDIKEQITTNDWAETFENGSLFLNNLLIDTWHETRRNPRPALAVLATGAVFVLGHKYGHIASKNLSFDTCDAAINKQYLAAKKGINENVVSPIISRMPSAPFFISPIFVVVKAIGGFVERYFLCSKPYIVGSFATGGGFYLCGHPIAAGFVAASILLTGLSSQSTAELKLGQQEIKADVADLKDVVQKQGAQLRGDITNVVQQATRNKEELKKEIQGVSQHIDDVSAHLTQEMQKQIAAATNKTEDNLTRLATHIDDKFMATNKNVVSEIAKIDEKIIDVLAKINLVAQEAARKELIEQLSELNKKSEELKKLFCQEVKRLNEQGVITREHLDLLQKEVAALQQQQSKDSVKIGEMHQKINTVLDKQATIDKVLEEMKDVQLQIQIGVAQHNTTLKSLVVSNEETAPIINDIKNNQKAFARDIALFISKLKKNKKQSNDLLKVFFQNTEAKINLVQQEVAEVRQEMTKVTQEIKQDTSEMREEIVGLKQENLLLRNIIEDCYRNFEEAQRQRDIKAKEKRKKDKKILESLSSGQKNLGKKIDNLGENLARVATQIVPRLQAIGDAVGQVPHLSLAEKVPTVIDWRNRLADL